MAARLRLAVAAELDAMGGLMRRSMAEIGPGYYSAEDAERAARYLTIPDPDLIEDRTSWLVEDDGLLVACGAWSSRAKLFTGNADQEALSVRRVDPAIDAAKIRAFFVDPGAARGGYGRQLWEICAAEAYGAGFRRVELMATLPGVPFYRRLGFIPSEPTEITLGDGRPLAVVPLHRGLSAP